MSDRVLQKAGSGDAVRLTKEPVGTKIKGIYESKKSIPSSRGYKDSQLYTIRQADGSVVSVWGFTVMNYRMEEIPFNRYVEITYTGMKPNKKGEPTHTADVLYDPNPLKAPKVDETNDDLPF